MVLLFVTLLLATATATVSAKSLDDQGKSSKASDLSGSFDVNSTEVEQGEILSFDEMAKVYTKKFGISLEQAKKRLYESSVWVSNTGKVTPLSLAGNVDIQDLAYSTLSSNFTVTSTYKPTLEYYSQVDMVPGSSFRAIVKILDVNLDRSYNGLSKQFSGKVYTFLENPNRIKYTVNGDWYNNGTTTFDGGLNLTVGKSATIKFGVSHSTNHYKYKNVTGYYNY